MAQKTIIRSLLGFNPATNPEDFYMNCAWDTINTVTRAVYSGAVEVLLTNSLNAQQCEVAIRDRVAEHILEQTGITMDPSNTFQSALRRG